MTSDAHSLSRILGFRQLGGYEQVNERFALFVARHIDLPTTGAVFDPLPWLPLWMQSIFSTGEEMIRKALRRKIKARKYFSAPRWEWAQHVAKCLRIGLVELRRVSRCCCGSFTRLKVPPALRWLFDGRPVNVLHGPPLKMEVVTPLSLSSLQCSPRNPLYLTKADIVSYFHQLRCPIWL